MMTRLQRLRPSPIPAIHPVPEYLATGRLADRYTDMKQVLQAPWMGVVTMAYAHYPTFFGELWRGLKPLCQSRAFVEASRDMQQFIEARTAELEPTSLRPQRIIRDRPDHPERVSWRNSLLDVDIGEQRPAPPIRSPHHVPPPRLMTEGIMRKPDRKGFFSSLFS
jgi:hypothetical protein